MSEITTILLQNDQFYVQIDYVGAKLISFAYFDIFCD